MPFSIGPPGSWVSRVERVIAEDPEFAQSPFAAEIQARAMQANAAGWAPEENELKYLEQLVRAARQTGTWRQWSAPTTAAGGYMVGQLPGPNMTASNIVPMARGGIITASPPPPRPQTPPTTPTQTTPIPQAPTPAKQPTAPAREASTPPTLIADKQTSTDAETFFGLGQSMTPKEGETASQRAKRFEETAKKMQRAAGSWLERAARTVDAYDEMARVFEENARLARQYSRRVHPLTVQAYTSAQLLAAQRARANAGELMLRIYSHMDPLVRQATIDATTARDVARTQGLLRKMANAKSKKDLEQTMPDIVTITNSNLRQHARSEWDRRWQIFDAEEKINTAASAYKRNVQAIKASNNAYEGMVRGAFTGFQKTLKSKDLNTIVTAADEARAKITSAYVAFINSVLGRLEGAPPRAIDAVTRQVSGALDLGMRLMDMHLRRIDKILDAEFARRGEMRQQRILEHNLRATSRDSRALSGNDLDTFMTVVRKLISPHFGIQFNNWIDAVSYVAKNADNAKQRHVVAALIGAGFLASPALGNYLRDTANYGFKAGQAAWQMELREGEKEESAENEKEQEEIDVDEMGAGT